MFVTYKKMYMYPFQDIADLDMLFTLEAFFQKKKKQQQTNKQTNKKQNKNKKTKNTHKKITACSVYKETFPS